MWYVHTDFVSSNLYTGWQLRAEKKAIKPLKLFSSSKTHIISKILENTSTLSSNDSVSTIDRAIQ